MNNFAKLLKCSLYVIALLMLCVMTYFHATQTTNVIQQGLQKYAGQDWQQVLQNQQTTRKSVDTPASVTTIKIMGVGDIMAHMPQVYAARTAEGYDFRHFFQYVKPIFAEADLVIGNLETVLGGEELGYQGYPTFNSPDALADGLKDAEFDVIVTANNHTFDQGEAGVVRTLDQLDRVNLLHTGSYRSPEESTDLLIVEEQGIKVAVLSYTDVLNIPLQKGKEHLVNKADLEKMEVDIARVREKGAEVVVICLHFGEEYQTKPNRHQLEMVDHLFALGADVIFGSHPHVVQPYEVWKWVDEKGEKRAGAVIYSLGNFISNQREHPQDLGGIFSVEVEKAGEVVTLGDAEFIPTYVYRYRNANTRIYHIMPMEELVTTRPLTTLDESAYQALNERFVEIEKHASTPLIDYRHRLGVGQVHTVQPKLTEADGAKSVK